MRTTKWRPPLPPNTLLLLGLLPGISWKQIPQLPVHSGIDSLHWMSVHWRNLLYEISCTCSRERFTPTYMQTMCKHIACRPQNGDLLCSPIHFLVLLLGFVGGNSSRRTTKRRPPLQPQTIPLGIGPSVAGNILFKDSIYKSPGTAGNFIANFSVFLHCNSIILFQGFPIWHQTTQLLVR